MHHINNSLNEKPRLINTTAVQLASMAEPIYEYLDQIKNQEGTVSQLPVVDIDDWLDIYRRPSRLKKLTKARDIVFLYQQYVG